MGIRSSLGNLGFLIMHVKRDFNLGVAEFNLKLMHISNFGCFLFTINLIFLRESTLREELNPNCLPDNQNLFNLKENSENGDTLTSW